jgi:hypothetical protein
MIEKKIIKIHHLLINRDNTDRLAKFLGLGNQPDHFDETGHVSIRVLVSVLGIKAL